MDDVKPTKVCSPSKADAMAADAAPTPVPIRAQDPAKNSPLPPAPDPHSAHVWQDALLAAGLLKAAGPALGGLWLKARAGGVREAYLTHLERLFGRRTPWIRMPASAGPSTLLGSLDIPATARMGRIVTRSGLLARADKGALQVPMAERLDPATAALIGTVMDTGRTRPQAAAGAQCGQTRQDSEDRCNARFQVIAVDESASHEETLPPALADRLGLIVDLSAVSWSAVTVVEEPLNEHAAPDWQSVSLSAPVTRFLSGIAQAAGATSLRRLRHLTLVSRLLAAMEGRDCVDSADALAAARLCLGIRPEAHARPEDTAVKDGSGESAPAPAPNPAQAPPTPQSGTQDTRTDTPQRPEQNLAALSDMLAAVEAGTITGLPELAASSPARSSPSRSGKAGAAHKNARRGRPVAISRTAPFPDARPHLIATLRAAAPWQSIRNRNRALLLSRLSGRDQDPIRQPKALITRDDYRFQRLRHETPSTAIFMVDASGSTALERLGETKGAIEQLLSRCYVRRDEVAMIAFRGTGAETVLPPTRSLVLAKRKLAGLPGGGPTPLVSGLEKGLTLALSVRRQGSTPVLVLLTDGRGNIARNGQPDRPRAQAELTQIAGQYRAHRMRSICIDIARRPRESVALLADTMGADLHVLRHADAGSMAGVVHASLQEAGR